MKDYIGRNRWWNRAMKNPTAHSRFLRTRLGPRGELESGFTNAVKGFDKAMRRKKTIYEKYFGEL